MSPCIQVDLDNKYIVVGLQTEGESPYWVEQIKEQVGMSEENLIFVDDIIGHPKVCCLVYIVA